MAHRIAREARVVSNERRKRRKFDQEPASAMSLPAAPRSILGSVGSFFKRKLGLSTPAWTFNADDNNGKRQRTGDHDEMVDSEMTEAEAEANLETHVYFEAGSRESEPESEPMIDIDTIISDSTPINPSKSAPECAICENSTDDRHCDPNTTQFHSVRSAFLANGVSLAVITAFFRLCVGQYGTPIALNEHFEMEESAMLCQRHFDLCTHHLTRHRCCVCEDRRKKSPTKRKKILLRNVGRVVENDEVAAAMQSFFFLDEKPALAAPICKEHAAKYIDPEARDDRAVAFTCGKFKAKFEQEHHVLLNDVTAFHREVLSEMFPGEKLEVTGHRIHNGWALEKTLRRELAAVVGVNVDLLPQYPRTGDVKHPVMFYNPKKIGKSKAAIKTIYDLALAVKEAKEDVAAQQRSECFGIRAEIERQRDMLKKLTFQDLETLFLPGDGGVAFSADANPALRDSHGKRVTLDQAINFRLVDIICKATKRDSFDTFFDDTFENRQSGHISSTATLLGTPGVKRKAEEAETAPSRQKLFDTKLMARVLLIIVVLVSLRSSTVCAIFQKLFSVVMRAHGLSDAGMDILAKFGITVAPSHMWLFMETVQAAYDVNAEVNSGVPVFTTLSIDNLNWRLRHASKIYTSDQGAPMLKRGFDGITSQWVKHIGLQPDEGRDPIDLYGKDEQIFLDDNFTIAAGTDFTTRLTESLVARESMDTKVRQMESLATAVEKKVRPVAESAQQLCADRVVFGSGLEGKTSDVDDVAMAAANVWEEAGKPAYQITVVDQELAATLDAVKEKYPGDFDWMIVWIGDWHLLKNIGEILVNLTWDGGMKRVRGLLGHTADAEQGSKYQWSDTHRMNLVFHEALSRQLLRAFRESQGAVARVTMWATRTEARKFREWKQRLLDSKDSSNEVLSCYVKIAHYYDAYVGLFTAIRGGHWDQRNWAIRRVVPLTFAFGHDKYAPLISKHIVTQLCLRKDAEANMRAGGFALCNGNENSDQALDEGHEAIVNLLTKKFLCRVSHHTFEAMTAFVGYMLRVTAGLTSWLYCHSAKEATHKPYQLGGTVESAFDALAYVSQHPNSPRILEADLGGFGKPIRDTAKAAKCSLSQSTPTGDTNVTATVTAATATVTSHIVSSHTVLESQPQRTRSAVAAAAAMEEAAMEDQAASAPSAPNRSRRNPAPNVDVAARAAKARCLTENQRFSLLNFHSIGQNRFIAYLRNEVCNPRLPVADPSDLKYKQHSKCRTFSKPTQSKKNSEKNAISHRAITAIRNQANRLGVIVDAVFAYPLAFCTELGERREVHKSEYLYKKSKSGKVSGLMKFMGTCFSLGRSPVRSAAVERIHDINCKLHAKPSPILGTFRAFASRLFDEVVISDWKRGVSVCTIVFDKPRLAPPPKTLLTKKERKKKATLQACNSEEALNAELQKGYLTLDSPLTLWTMNWSLALQIPEFRNQFNTLLTEAFIQLAKEQQSTFPTKSMIIDSQALQSPIKVFQGRAATLISRTNNAPEADHGVCWHVLRSDCPVRCVVGTDTDLVMILAALADEIPELMQPNVQLYVDQPTRSKLGSPARYIDVSQMVREARKLLPNLKHPLFCLGYVYTLSGTDFVNKMEGIGPGKLLESFIRHADFICGKFSASDGGIGAQTELVFMNDDALLDVSEDASMRLFSVAYWEHGGKKVWPPYTQKLPIPILMKQLHHKHAGREAWTNMTLEQLHWSATDGVNGDGSVTTISEWLLLVRRVTQKKEEKGHMPSDGALHFQTRRATYNVRLWWEAQFPRSETRDCWFDYGWEEAEEDGCTVMIPTWDYNFAALQKQKRSDQRAPIVNSVSRRHAQKKKVNPTRVGDARAPTTNPTSTGHNDTIQQSQLSNAGLIAPAGLENQPETNACYLNAVLQCLFVLPDMVEAILSLPNKCPMCASPVPVSTRSTRSMGPIQQDRDHTFLCKLKSTVNKCQAVPPEGYAKHSLWVSVGQLSDVASQQLTPGQQEDAQQFLLQLLQHVESVSAPASRPGDLQTCPMSKILEGTETHARDRCPTCKAAGGSKTEKFLYVPLNVQGQGRKPTIFTALQRKIDKGEKLDAANGVRCHQCSRLYQATRTWCMTKAPPCLCFMLERFNYNRGGVKVPGHIEPTPQLHVTVGAGGTATRADYCLCGVVVHDGLNVSTGHYRAYVRKGEQWWLMDDRNATAVDEKDVLAQEAYLCFYRSLPRPAPIDSAVRHL